MKRLFLILAFLSVGAALHAEPVSPVSARSYAGRFFNGNASDIRLKSSTDLLPGTANGKEPTFYVAENPSGGWVILSGDDCTYPVLGYSDKGSLPSGELPPNAAFWLSRIDGNVKALRKAGVRGSNEVRGKWESLGIKTKSFGTAKLIVTADWDQQAPYNNMCPHTTDGEPTLTGCVATAMSIILRHHKWPEHGKGTLETYTTYSRQLKINGFSIESHNYNWDNMPLTYSSSSTAAQNSEVARLMYDCGVMVHMDYDPKSSGAYSANIVPALARHMSYKASARELYHCNYSDREWLDMIKTEILEDRPVLYGGSDIDDTRIGHQFVCDGFDENGMIHVNWGWGGDYNGYFAVTYVGSKEMGGVFNYYDSAIFGLEPDPTGTSEPDTELLLYGSSDGSWRGISLLDGKIAGGMDFTLSIGFICNESFETDYNGKIKAALIDRNGSVREFIGEEVEVNVPVSYGVTYGNTCVDRYPCRISVEPIPGDAIAIFYRLSDGSWVKMGGNRDSNCTISALGAFDFSFINVEDSYRAGQTYYFDIVAGQKVIKKRVNYFDNMECTKGFVILTSGQHTVSVALTYEDGSSETVEQKIRVN